MPLYRSAGRWTRRASAAGIAVLVAFGVYTAAPVDAHPSQHGGGATACDNRLGDQRL
jgi:hypothetical protein